MTETQPSKPSSEELYDLLPAIYRIRDAEVGEPLRRLLSIIQEQLNIVESDLDRLLDNWFIETCEDWVVPYIGDLVGYRMIGSVAPTESETASLSLTKALFPRAAVANTVRSRRRKGTLAVLEELANDLGDWPARAVEFHRLLCVTQPIQVLGTTDLHPLVWSGRGRTLDLHDGEALDLLDGPFETSSRTVDVRRPTSGLTPGRFNIPDVGVFAFRLRGFRVTSSEAFCLEDEDPHRFTFSILGNDAPLFTLPTATPSATEITTESTLTLPIRRRALDRHPATFIGDDLSFSLRIGSRDEEEIVSADRIVSADLKDWRYRPRAGNVLVDPERGRMLFSHDLFDKVRERVVVSYRYGFSDDIGGGEYDRPLLTHPDAEVRRACGKKELLTQLGPWLDPEKHGPQPRHAVVEIGDSAVYDVAMHLRLQPGHTLQVRAANSKRPVLRLPDRSPGSDALRITGGEMSSVTLDGLWVVGNAVQVDGFLDALTIRHCTLVPGWGLGPDCEPTRPARPGLELIDVAPRTCVENSILGSVQVILNAVERDPVALTMTDSIIDATALQRTAVSALGGGRAHAKACFKRCTVIGSVCVDALVLAENSVFLGEVLVARTQTGCMRFCSVPPESRTPRRYECQPDLVDAVVDARFPAGAQRERARERERLRVQPVFNSTRFGRPEYCQLAWVCAPEISRGAEDESEMGVFHDLFQPQRTDTLQTALNEFTPADVDAALFFAN